MTSVLNSYLVQHKSLSIPGLGTIYVEWEPVTRDAEKDRWLPPAVRYRFDKFHDTPGKDFFHFLAEHKKIPEYEAINWYNKFAAAFRAEIKTREEARWEGVGIFKKDMTGEIVLEQLHKPFLLFEPVEAHEIIYPVAPEPVVEQDGEAEAAPAPPEEELAPATVKSTWWLYVLVLFAIILLVLGFHFYQKGLVWHSFFNQQPVL